MTAPLKSIEGSSIAAAMADIGRRAKAAARTLALSPAAQRDAHRGPGEAPCETERNQHQRRGCVGGFALRNWHAGTRM